jgi:hypothetical protein
MSDPIQLYSKLGAKTDYYLTITVNNKYYITKRVPDPDTYFSDRAKYRFIILNCVVDPLHIVVDNQPLFIDDTDLHTIL